MFQQRDNTTDQLTITAKTGLPTVQFNLASDLHGHRADSLSRGPDMHCVGRTLPPAQRFYEGILDAPLGCSCRCTYPETMPSIVELIETSCSQGRPDCSYVRTAPR